MKKWAYNFLILSVVLTVHKAVLVKGQIIEITHWNDISGQIEAFEPGTSSSSKAPTPCSRPSCIGGAVNLAQHISTRSHPSAAKYLSISSGNLVGGESGWISSIGWLKYGEFVKKCFVPDILVPGMKEFGAGVRRTNEFISTIGSVTQTVLANTCDGSQIGDELSFCNSIVRISKVDVGASSIGIIGFVTPTVERLSLPGSLKFKDVVAAIKAVVEQEKGNIKGFIAVGDGTLSLAQKILDEVKEVSVVIYGSGLSNTADMTGSYPRSYNGKLIATAGRYGSSIGKLVLQYDSSTGKLTNVTGYSKLVKTVRVDPKNEMAETALNEIDKNLLPDVNAEKANITGHSRVTLQGGEVCWRGECNLGNLVADSMVHCALSGAPLAKPFPYHIHAIWHGGALFEDVVSPGAVITKFDIHKWLPYHNRAHLVKITGAKLRKVFEKSATGIDPKKAGEKDWRQFLQVSNGMEIYFNTKSGAPKLTKIRMTHDKNGVPELGDMQDSTDYYLMIPTYLYEGRGVYDFAQPSDYWIPVSHQNVSSNHDFDDNCVEGYIRSLKQISVGFEERIWIDQDSSSSSCDGVKGASTTVTVILTIVFFSIFLAVIYVGIFYVIPRLRRPREYPPNQL